MGFLGMIITWDSLWEFVLRIERSLRLRRVFFKAEAKEKKMEQVKGAFDLDGKTLNFGGGQLIVEDEQNKVMIGGGMVIVEQLDKENRVRVEAGGQVIVEQGEKRVRIEGGQVIIEDKYTFGEEGEKEEEKLVKVKSNMRKQRTSTLRLRRPNNGSKN